MPPVAAAQFLVTTFNSGFGHAFSYAYVVGIYAGPALMGIALRRSRSVPRWLAVLFFAGLESDDPAGGLDLAGAAAQPLTELAR